MDNEENILYCKNCMSITIARVSGTTTDYCMDCGNIHIESIEFPEWEKLYKREYGVSFIEHEKPNNKRRK